jgi:hypothetical protein
LVDNGTVAGDWTALVGAAMAAVLFFVISKLTTKK